MQTHISHSQVSMYLRCQAQYYFRYIMGLKFPPPGPLAFGICFDHGLNGNYTPKIETGKDLSFHDVSDIFVQKWKEFDDSGTDWQVDKPAALRDKGQELIKLHLEQEAKKIMPLTVQENLEMLIDNKISVKTVTDIVTVDSNIIDIKTAGKSPSVSDTGRIVKDRIASLKDSKKNKIITVQQYEDELKMLNAQVERLKAVGQYYGMDMGHRSQGFIYELSYFAKYGRHPFNTVFKYHVKSANPTICTAVHTSTQSELNYTVNLYKTVHKAIQVSTENDCFAPNRSHMMCSEKQCGYWHECHKKFGPEIIPEKFVA